jgi:hypothetical protein
MGHVLSKKKHKEAQFSVQVGHVNSGHGFVILVLKYHTICDLRRRSK